MFEVDKLREIIHIARELDQPLAFLAEKLIKDFDLDNKRAAELREFAALNELPPVFEPAILDAYRRDLDRLFST